MPHSERSRHACRSNLDHDLGDGRGSLIPSPMNERMIRSFAESPTSISAHIAFHADRFFTRAFVEHTGRRNLCSLNIVYAVLRSSGSFVSLHWEHPTNTFLRRGMDLPLCQTVYMKRAVDEIRGHNW